MAESMRSFACLALFVVPMQLSGCDIFLAGFALGLANAANKQQRVSEQPAFLQQLEQIAEDDAERRAELFLSEIEFGVNGLDLVNARHLMDVSREPLRQKLVDLSESAGGTTTGLAATTTLLFCEDQAARKRFARTFPLASKDERAEILSALNDGLMFVDDAELPSLQKYVQGEPSLCQMLCQQTEPAQIVGLDSLPGVLEGLRPKGWEDALYRISKRVDASRRPHLEFLLSLSPVLKKEWLAPAIEAVSKSSDPEYSPALVREFLERGAPAEKALARKVLLEFVIRTRTPENTQDSLAPRRWLWSDLCDAAQAADYVLLEAEAPKEPAEIRWDIYSAMLRIDATKAKRKILPMLDHPDADERRQVVGILGDGLEGKADGEVIARLTKYAAQAVTDTDLHTVAVACKRIGGVKGEAEFERSLKRMSPEAREQLLIDLKLAPDLRLQKLYVDSQWLTLAEYQRGLAHDAADDSDRTISFQAENAEAWYVAFALGRADVIQSRRGEEEQPHAILTRRLLRLAGEKVKITALSEQPHPDFFLGVTQLGFISAGRGYQGACRTTKSTLDVERVLSLLNHACADQGLTERFLVYPTEVEDLLVVFGPPDAVKGLAAAYEIEEVASPNALFDEEE